MSGSNSEGVSESIRYHSCFLSYSNYDEEFAQRLQTDLENAGVRCWFSPKDLKIGDRIRDTIDAAIRESDKLVLILSDASVNQSDWGHQCGTCVPFDSIQEPGSYICNWSGHLLRIPEDGVTLGRSPMINIVGCEPLFVTKISENPFVTATKARLLAANFDLPVNF